MNFHARIQKIFSGGTTFQPGVVQQILSLQKPIFWKIEGGLNPLSPPPSESAHDFEKKAYYSNLRRLSFLKIFLVMHKKVKVNKILTNAGRQHIKE